MSPAVMSVAVMSFAVMTFAPSAFICVHLQALRETPSQPKLWHGPTLGRSIALATLPGKLHN